MAPGPQSLPTTWLTCCRLSQLPVASGCLLTQKSSRPRGEARDPCYPTDACFARMSHGSKIPSLKRQMTQSCKPLQSEACIRGMRKLRAQAGQKWTSCFRASPGANPAPAPLGSTLDFDAPVLGLSKCAPPATCHIRLAGPRVSCCCPSPSTHLA